MFDSLCGVEDFRMTEVGPHLWGTALGTPQVTPHIAHHLGLGARTPPSQRVGLDILIEQLVRIEVRAVARQEKEANLPPMACQPSFHTPGHMHRMPVHDEKDCASRMTDQSLQEHNKHEDREILVEDHECQLSTVGDRGDHVASEALSRAGDDRCLSAPPVGGTCLMVGAHPHFVAPVNRGFLSLCPGLDGRVLLCQPVTHGLGVPLVGPPQRLLGREPPAFEVSAHRPDGQLNAEPAGDEIPHRFARPEGKRQLELVRAPVGNQSHGGGGLPRSQSNDGGSSSRARPKGSHPTLPPTAMPPVDGLTGHSEDTSRLRLSHTPADGTDDAMTKRVLCNGRQTSGILTAHYSEYSSHLSTCQTFPAPISNNAGALFFAKSPQRFFPWSVFTVALFKDKNGVDIIDRKEITGGLFEIVDQVMDFVRLYAKVAYRFTGRPQRENIYEYPFDSIREAVINSVMHKYYFEHGHNNILRFLPDRIRIENYWMKPSRFILGETVFRRNNVIADLFARIHFGEKMGTGFERIREICKKENAPFPQIKFDENYFYVTFKPSRKYLKMSRTEKIQKEPGIFLNQRQKEAMQYLEENTFITTKIFADLVGVSERQARYDINDLMYKKVIMAEGSTTARKYRLRQTSANFGKKGNNDGQ